MEMLYYTVAAIFLYLASDWILNQIENRRGERFENRSFFSAPFSNKFMIAAFIGSATLQIAVAVVPFLALAFSLVPLTSTQWLITLLAPLLMLMYGEIEKLVKFLLHKK